MEIPVRSLRFGAMLLAAMLSGCAAASRPREPEPVRLGAPVVKFSNGRVTFVLVDEDGVAMPFIRVDFSWERPQFYKTSSFTDNLGRVTFSAVPEEATVSIDHPGGNYSRTLLVPQQGSTELRVNLNTFGAEARERERRMSLLSTGQ